MLLTGKLRHLIPVLAGSGLVVSSTVYGADTGPSTGGTGNGNNLDLDEVVVTAAPIATKLMQSSSSVSTLGEAEIALAAPSSAADILRDIPGIHSEASAGEGNTNVTVRGIPISAGGFRYVSLQEDGVPVLLNGDYDFVTPDMFVKLDGTLDHIEAVRGGAASILASNSPGAIINFITKTGAAQGGSVSASAGLNFDEQRYDFDYGQPIDEHTRFLVGGFFREGRGPRNGDVPIERGGQVKVSLTHDLGDSGSYLRAIYKHLDDQSPLNMPVSFSLSNANPTKANPATIEPYPGIDPRTASYYSPYWPTVTMRTADNNLGEADMNTGLTVREDALTLQTHLELGDGWRLEDTFRAAKKSGSFRVGYPTGAPFTPSVIPTYAAGPLKGQAYLGPVIELSAFDAALNDLGSRINLVKLSRQFAITPTLSITPLVGFDFTSQTVEVNQNLPHYLFTATGDQPIPLAGVNANGISTDPSGLLPDAQNWSEQNRQLTYEMRSPYLDVTAEIGDLSVDGGVREDKERVNGFQSNTSPAAAATPYLPGTFPTAPTNLVNYSLSHTSWSIGANYQITRDLAVFVRDSEGADFNVVERMSGPFIGGSPIPLNTVEQTEIGTKFRSGGFESFLTLFSARTAEENYDVTTNIVTADHYTAQGAELEAGYHRGGFAVRGGLTYTNAKIIGSNIMADLGDRPHRLARFMYQISPSYSVWHLQLGGSIIGTSQSYGDDENTIIQPAYFTVNLYTGCTLGDHTLVSVSANNVFNKIGWTEYDNGQGARSINGRLLKATVTYSF